MTKQQQAIMTFEILRMNFNGGHQVNLDWISMMSGVSEERTVEILNQLEEKNYADYVYKNNERYYYATLTGVRAFVSKGLDKPSVKLSFQYA